MTKKFGGYFFNVDFLVNYGNIIIKSVSRGGAARQLVGLITQRSQVQILSPLPIKVYKKAVLNNCFLHVSGNTLKLTLNINKKLLLSNSR